MYDPQSAQSSADQRAICVSNDVESLHVEMRYAPPSDGTSQLSHNVLVALGSDGHQLPYTLQARAGGVTSPGSTDAPSLDPTQLAPLASTGKGMHGNWP